MNTSCANVVRASRWAGRRRGSKGLPFAALRVPCGTRFEVAPCNSLRSLCSLRSNRHGESDHEAREYTRRPRTCVPRQRLFALPPARRLAARSSVFDGSNTNTVSRPEGGAATARFLVLQHERRRRIVLGPCEVLRMNRRQFRLRCCMAAPQRTLPPTTPMARRRFAPVRSRPRCSIWSSPANAWWRSASAAMCCCRTTRARPGARPRPCRRARR